MTEKKPDPIDDTIRTTASIFERLAGELKIELARHGRELKASVRERLLDLAIELASDKDK